MYRLLLTLSVLVGVVGCTRHYKVYEIQPRDVQQEVSLYGQFDQQPVRHRIERVTHFANPVGKYGFSPRNKHEHLTWYELRQHGHEQPRQVVFKNQFTKRLSAARLGDPKFLLVPSEKIEKGSEFPETLEHFKCYEITDSEFDPVRPLTLVDQFGKHEQVKIDKPELFCVPVRKEVEGWNTKPVRDKKTHLVVYPIFAPRDEPRQVSVRNQFHWKDPAGFSVLNPIWLCVPSEKLGWKPYEP
jgi:hypothetical protein